MSCYCFYRLSLGWLKDGHPIQFRGQYTAIGSWYETKAESSSMARIARVVVPNCPHHVVQREVSRMDVFFSLEDRQEYLRLISQAASKHDLDFFGW